MNLSALQTKHREIGAFLLLYAVSAMLILVASRSNIYTPLSPVPFTLENLIVLVVSCRRPFIGSTATFTAMLMINNILTLGYRAGMFILSLLSFRIRNCLLLGAVGYTIIYILGYTWICICIKHSVGLYGDVFAKSIAPFILPDIIKVICADKVLNKNLL